MLKKTKCGHCVMAARAGSRAAACSCHGGVDLRLFHCFVLVHFDGGDGMLGAGLHLPVHLPLGILRLGLEQVHSLLCFDPAGKEKGKNRTSQFYYR